MQYARWIINIVVAVLVIFLAVKVAKKLIESRKPLETTPVIRISPEVAAPAIEPVRDYQVEIVGFGSARPKVSVDVTPQVSGEVIDKHPDYQSGEFISADQILFTIDPTDFKLAADRADSEIALIDAKLSSLDVTEANLEELLTVERDRLALAQADYRRTEELVRQAVATETELDRSRETVLARELQIRILKNQLAELPPMRIELDAQKAVSLVQQRQAQTDLARTIYRSPFAGRVIDCPLEAGERVQAGQECGTIYATDVMEVPVPLAASDIAWIDTDAIPDSDDEITVDPTTGMPSSDDKLILATIVYQAGANAEPMIWYGYVSRIEAGQAAQTRMTTVIIKVVNPPVGTDRPMLDINMFCRVTLMGEPVPTAFVIPRSAAQPIEDQAVTDLRTANVYLVDNPQTNEGEFAGQLVRRQVRVARYTDDEAMILPGNGLADGDRVVIGYIPKPVPGMTIRIRGEQPEPTTPPPAGDED
jgi:multidrug efflux pump subunit AcrA (membrane-fusion protein)